MTVKNESAVEALEYLLNVRSVMENHLNNLDEVMNTIGELANKTIYDFDEQNFIEEAKTVARIFSRNSEWSGYEEASKLYDIYSEHDKYLKARTKSRYVTATEDDGCND